MNPLKSEVKILVAENIGREMEGFAEGAQKQVHMQQGAKEGLEHAAQKVAELLEHIDKDFDNGGLEGFKNPLKVMEYAKRYIKRSIGVIDNLARVAEISKIKYGGKEKGFSEAAAHINKLWKEEKTKLENFAKMLEQSESGEVIAEGKFQTVKQKRQAEKEKEEQRIANEKKEVKEEEPKEKPKKEIKEKSPKKLSIKKKANKSTKES